MNLSERQVPAGHTGVAENSGLENGWRGPVGCLVRERAIGGRGAGNGGTLENPRPVDQHKGRPKGDSPIFADTKIGTVPLNLVDQQNGGRY